MRQYFIRGQHRTNPIPQPPPPPYYPPPPPAPPNPVLTNVLASQVAQTTAVISWTVDQSANGQVDYGTTSSYGSSSAVDPAALSHTILLTGLTAFQNYHFRVKSTNSASEQTISGDYGFTTLAVVDTTPPAISNVQATSVTQTSATITWSQNEAGTAQVDYGPDSTYGSSTAISSTYQTSQVVLLPSLAPGSTYHFRVKTHDLAGNLAVSGDFNFTTASLPSAPVITAVTASAISQTGATISWTCNELCSGQVAYGTTTNYGLLSTFQVGGVYSAHIQTLSGLTAGTLYHFRVQSQGATDNMAYSADTTFTTTTNVDTTPPVISSIGAGSPTQTGATISWTTDEPATSQVEWGLTSSYGNSTTLNTTLVTSHAQPLSGLTGTTIYHFRVKSTDGSGNQAVSGDNTFTTSGTINGTNVKASPYNAKGDGVTDDSAAIQTCFNAVAGTGGTVVIPDGTYLINGNYSSSSFGLRPGSNMTIAMTSGAVLQVKTMPTDNYSALTIGTCSNVTITGGTIIGDRLTHTDHGGQDGHGIYIGNASNITISGVTLKQCWGDGIYIASSSSSITWTNCVCDHNYRMGASAVEVNGLTVSGSTFSNTGKDGPLLSGGGSGFDLEPNSGQVVTNVNFHDNIVTGNSQYGVGTGGRDDLSTSNVTINHNTITGNGNDGVYCNDGTTTSSVTNNTITGNAGCGIELGSPDTVNMTVTGNTVSNNSSWGIYVSSATNATVTGNTGAGNGHSGIGLGSNTGGTFSPNTVS